MLATRVEGAQLDRLRNILLIFALALYLALLAFPFLASVLVAPPAGVAVLVLGWAAGLGALLLLMRRESWWGLAMPPAALAFWAATVTIGESFFGWTA